MLILSPTINIHFTSIKWLLIVSATFNMPQTPMNKGFEACYVNRLNLFANCDKECKAEPTLLCTH